MSLNFILKNIKLIYRNSGKTSCKFATFFSLPFLMGIIKHINVDGFVNKSFHYLQEVCCKYLSYLYFFDFRINTLKTKVVNKVIENEKKKIKQSINKKKQSCFFHVCHRILKTYFQPFSFFFSLKSRNSKQVKI